MGRTADGKWSEEWTPPVFSVDANGKVVGYENDRTPNNWGRFGYRDAEFARAVDLIVSGRVSLAHLITHRFALHEADRALTAPHPDDHVVKVAIVPMS